MSHELDLGMMVNGLLVSGNDFSWILINCKGDERGRGKKHVSSIERLEIWNVAIFVFVF